MNPVPFEIVQHEGMTVASNGHMRLVVVDEGGKIVRRRGIAGISTKPAGDVLLPQINQFAGELLKNMEMPAPEAAARLTAIAGLIPHTEPRRIEWAMAELNGVRVYTDGVQVVVTTRDINPV